MANRGWFADVDPDSTTEFAWQPCLNLNNGHIPSLAIYFKTRAECEQWMADSVIGTGWDEDEPGTPDLRQWCACDKDERIHVHRTNLGVHQGRNCPADPVVIPPGVTP